MVWEIFLNEPYGNRNVTKYAGGKDSTEGCTNIEAQVAKLPI